MSTSIFLSSYSLTCTSADSHLSSCATEALQEAFKSYDPSKIKEALALGASFDQTLEMPSKLEYALKSTELSLKNDPQLISECFLWLADLLQSIAEDEDMEYLLASPYLEASAHLIQERIDQGHTFSKELPQSIITLVRETALLTLSDEQIDAFLEDLPSSTTLFEFAADIRDLELMQMLLDLGDRPQCNLWKIEDFFDTTCFTPKKIEMIELMERYGYSLEDLLHADQSINSILIDAYEDGDDELIMFLENRGHRLKISPEFEKKENCFFLKA